MPSKVKQEQQEGTEAGRNQETLHCGSVEGAEAKQPKMKVYPQWLRQRSCPGAACLERPRLSPVSQATLSIYFCYRISEGQILPTESPWDCSAVFEGKVIIVDRPINGEKPPIYVSSAVRGPEPVCRRSPAGP